MAGVEPTLPRARAHRCNPPNGQASCAGERTALRVARGLDLRAAARAEQVGADGVDASPRPARRSARCAPRRRSVSDSAAAEPRANARIAPSRSMASRGDAVGLQAEDRRPAPHRRGVQVRRAPEAAVDVLAPRRSAPAGTSTAPSTTRAPRRRRSPPARPARRTRPASRSRASTAVTNSRPSNVPSIRSSALAQPRDLARRPPPAPQRRGAHRRPGGRDPGAHGGHDHAQRTLDHPPKRARHPRERTLDHPRKRVRHLEEGRGLGPAARGEGRGDDRAGGRAEEGVAGAEVPAGLGFEAGEAGAQPGLAQHAAATEHEDVGAGGGRSYGSS